MRTYEMMVIIDPSPDMDKIDQAITRIEEMITEKIGDVIIYMHLLEALLVDAKDK